MVVGVLFLVGALGGSDSTLVEISVNHGRSGVARTPPGEEEPADKSLGTAAIAVKRGNPGPASNTPVQLGGDGGNLSTATPAPSGTERTSLGSMVLVGQADPGTGPRLKGALASWRALPEVNRTSQTPWWKTSLIGNAARGKESLDVAVNSSAMTVAHFGFPRAPKLGVQGSYVYVTSPQHMAALVELEPKQDSIHFTMEAADPVRVRVVDAGGEPVAAAQVQSVGWIAGVAERLVERTYLSDLDGFVDLCPLPNPSLLLATQAGRSSPLWLGEHSAVGGGITLTLVEGFVARGQVTGAPTPEALDSCTILVRGGETNRVPGALRDEWGKPLATAAIGRDGAWSAPSVPWIGPGEYVFRMQGEGVTPSEERVHLDSPQDVLADFAWSSGSGLRLIIRDEATDPIANALVSARWKTAEGWMDYHMRTPADGVAILESLPEAEVYVRVSADGFATMSYGPFNMPAASAAEGFLLDMQRAAYVEGRCIYRGAPVQDFDVTYWGGASRESRVTESFRNAPDGRFVLDAIPVGDVHVLATSDGTAPSEVVTVQAPGVSDSDELSAAVPFVELELTDSIASFGRVVDGTTGKSIVGAKVIPHSASDTLILDVWEDPVYTDGLGEFEGLPLAPMNAALRVEAAGFSPYSKLLGRVHESPHNVGVISLERFQALEVQLYSYQKEDFSSYTATLYRHPPQSFDASGYARFGQVEVGNHRLSVQPENMHRRIDTWFSVRASQENRIEVYVEFGPRSVVELVLDEGVTIPDLIFLNVYRDSKRSGALRRLETFDENLQVELSLPPGERMVFTVMDHLRNLIVTDWVTTSDNGGDRITLEVHGQAHHLLFVDSKRQPVPGPRVRVGVPPLESVTGWLSTGCDAQGRLTLRDVTERRVLLYATGPGSSVGQIQEVTLGPSSPDEPILVPYECDYPILASARERGQAVDGISLSLHHSLAGAILDLSSSDGAGQVPFGPLAAGDYVVQIQSGGYWPDVFALRAPDPGQQQVFEVRRLGGIRVELSKEGSPMGGLTVEFTSEERGTRASVWLGEGRVSTGPSGLVSAADGSVELSGVPNGEYTLHVTLPGGESFEQIVVVPAHAEGLVRIELP